MGAGQPLSTAGSAQGGRWLRDLAAAAVVAMAAISFYVSAATLLFQGELAQYLSVAIGAVLLSGVLLTAAGAWRGSLALAASGPEPATVPVLAAITAGIAASVSGPALLPTTMMALALTAATVGLLWWLGGRRGWGELMRYIPYPVIGGFIGSIGWLMVTGGLGVSASESFSLSRAWAWLHGAGDWRLLAGLLLGIAIWRATLRFTHPLTLPIVLAVGALAVHAALALAGLDITSARAAGWLLSSFTQPQVMLPWWPDALAQVRWDAIAAQVPLMASAVIVATIGLLLSDTSLEVAWDEDADINRDLRVLGQANLAAAGVGALVGGISISRSLLNRAAGAQGRGSNWLNAGFCTVAMIGGGPLIALVPRPLLGGVLIYLGLGMLKAWLIDSRQRLPRREYTIVVTMVLLTAVFGFLPAVCAGVLACCLEFTAMSARLAPVRRLLRRSQWPSKTERGAAQNVVLQHDGDGLHIVELQGALFFGSTSQMARQVDPLFGAGGRCLLFDFRHVKALDTSAGQSLARLFKAARRRGLRVELSGLTPVQRATLQAGGALLPGTREHGDVDAAVDAWDVEVLAQHAGPLPAAWMPPEFETRWLDEVFEGQRLPAGAVLFAQGDPADALYLVRSGCIAIHAHGDGPPTLLRTVHAGSVIGEMGFLRGLPRSATATVVDEAQLWVLDRARFEQQVQREPRFESALLRLFLSQMASRVEQLGAQARQLAR